MGRVPNTAQAKAFEGNPSSISDRFSIQNAVKGTVIDEATATKNMATLAGLARLDMFQPKRTGAAVDTNQFRNYPTPTIDIIGIEATKSGTSNDWDVDVILSLAVNHYVGFDAKIEVECTVNLNASFTQTIDRFIKKKETSIRSVSTSGTVNNTITFSFTGVPNGTGGGDAVDVNLSFLYLSLETVGGANSPSGGGAAYYEPSNLITLNDIGTVTAPYPYGWGTFTASSLSCDLHTTSGTEFTTYTAVSTLAVGTNVYTTNVGTALANGTYRMFAGGADFYLVTIVNGSITSITTCNSGIGGFG